nr:MAG TPA: BppU domain protein [Caudoviricetes sp.]
MISGEFTRKIDVDAEILMTPIRTLYASGDKNAHTFELSLYRNKEPLKIDGAGVIGYFIRADGYTVPVNGTVSGSVAKVTLSESCYAVIGQFNLIIKVTVGSERRAVFWGNGYITRSQTDAIIDPSQTIPSLDELLAQIAATEAAAKAANRAASAANSAATSAAQAASAADTNASAANSAANAATEAASAASVAATKIDDMTITATGLAAGAAPTAELTEVGGHYNIVLGLPKGDKGGTGATPQITVQVKTGEPGTAASVKQTGTAEAPVIELTIPRGDTGSLGNLTINDKAPDGAGKVTLTAADLGALDKDVHMYNLLDNSDFVHPINQRGETSKQASWVYWIDRWLSDTEKTAAQLTSSGIRLPATTEKNLRILQRVPLERIKKGQSYTIAAYDASGNVLCVSGVFNGGTLTGDGLSEGKYYLSLQSGDNSTYYYCILDAYADITVKCMALYEGEYTAETLPPYVPKGYAAELAECLRYYRKIKSNNETFSGYAANGVAYAFIPLQEMRIAPTVTGGGKFYYTLGSAQGTTTETATAHNASANRVVVKCAVSVTGICTGVITPQGDIDISADL